MNAAGTIQEAYDTDAYGNTLIYSAAGGGSDWWANDATTTNGLKCSFIFTGRRYDAETQIYFYRARYYEPGLGRFLGKDPIGYIDTLNSFLYVNSNPTVYLDPSGLLHAIADMDYTIEHKLPPLPEAKQVKGSIPGDTFMPLPDKWEDYIQYGKRMIRTRIRMFAAYIWGQYVWGSDGECEFHAHGYLKQRSESHYGYVTIQRRYAAKFRDVWNRRASWLTHEHVMRIMIDLAKAGRLRKGAFKAVAETAYDLIPGGKLSRKLLNQTYRIYKHYAGENAWDQAIEMSRDWGRAGVWARIYHSRVLNYKGPRYEYKYDIEINGFSYEPWVDHS